MPESDACLKTGKPNPTSEEIAEAERLIEAKREELLEPVLAKLTCQSELQHE